MKKNNRKNIKIIIYISLVGVLFSFLISFISFGRRVGADLFLSNYKSTKWNLSNIPDNLKDERLLLQISKSIKSKDFEISKKYISGDNSENYFNAGTIKLIESYNLAKQDELSGLQLARLLISQANQDLEIADKIQITPYLKEYILKNKQTAEGLWTIIETKACYQEGGFLISEIKSTLDKANEIINEQSKQLEKLKNISPADSCISNLINIITNNQKQLTNVKNDLIKKSQEYKNMILEKLNSPEKCKGTSFEDVLKKTTEAKDTMQKYFQQQQEISQILESPTAEGLGQLCNGSKNDSQLNENLSNSISQMMKDLQKQSEKEKNKSGEPEKKEEGEKNENKKDSEKKEQGEKQDKDGKKDNKEGEKENKEGNGESEYKDVLNQQEREILNKTQQNSNNLIQQIQQIKGKGNYNGYEYIKNLFNSFMGNEGDLKDLHKDTDTDTEKTEGNGSNQTQRY